MQRDDVFFALQSVHQDAYFKLSKAPLMILIFMLKWVAYFFQTPGRGGGKQLICLGEDFFLIFLFFFLNIKLHLKTPGYQTSPKY